VSAGYRFVLVGLASGGVASLPGAFFVRPARVAHHWGRISL